MKFIHLRSFGNYIEANIALALLQENGIRCHTADEHSSTILSVPSGVRLMVHASQAERAAGLLRDAEAARLGDLICPRCHHTGFHIHELTETLKYTPPRILFGRRVAFLSKLFAQKRKAATTRRFICNNCRKELDELP